MADGQPVEHPPLTRLLAVLYFMSSSMLVQYTTKASQRCFSQLRSRGAYD